MRKKRTARRKRKAHPAVSISVPKLKLFQREKVTLQMHESAAVDPPMAWWLADQFLEKEYCIYL